MKRPLHIFQKKLCQVDHATRLLHIQKRPLQVTTKSNMEAKSWSGLFPGRNHVREVVGMLNVNGALRSGLIPLLYNVSGIRNPGTLDKILNGNRFTSLLSRYSLTNVQMWEKKTKGTESAMHRQIWNVGSQ